MPHLHFEQLVPLPITEAFRFFEDPANLLKITPPQMALTITNPEPVVMRKGAEIAYTLCVAGMPQRWRTLIAEYDPPHSFMDVQLRGPYRKWEHTHTLREVEGGTLMIDDIDYELPLGWLGSVIAGWFVRRQLAHVFAYRQAQIERLFPSTDS